VLAKGKKFLLLIRQLLCKKGLNIPKGNSDNAMAKRKKEKRTNKDLQDRKLKIEQC